MPVRTVVGKIPLVGATWQVRPLNDLAEQPVLFPEPAVYQFDSEW